MAFKSKQRADPEPVPGAAGEPYTDPAVPAGTRDVERGQTEASGQQRDASTSTGTGTGGQTPANMLPGRERRRFGAERLLVRLIATSGIVAIGVALGAILVSSNVHGWIVGLVVALVSVLLSAILWSSRQV